MASSPGWTVRQRGTPSTLGGSRDCPTIHGSSRNRRSRISGSWRFPCFPGHIAAAAGLATVSPGPPNIPRSSSVPTWLVTGGAGFIGGNFVLEAVASGVRVVNLDALTYAGNLDTLASLKDNPAHVFVQGAIGDREMVDRLLAEHPPDAVVNFAAERPANPPTDGPGAYVKTTAG